MFNYDITNHLNWYRGIFRTIISSIINLLKSFEFNGINLFTYILALAILAVVLRAILVHYKDPLSFNAQDERKLHDFYNQKDYHEIGRGR